MPLKPRKRTAVPVICRKSSKFCSTARKKARARTQLRYLRPFCVLPSLATSRLGCTGSLRFSAQPHAGIDRLLPQDLSVEGLRWGGYDHAVSGSLDATAGATFRSGAKSAIVLARFAGHLARGSCRHIYARIGRGVIAVFDVADNDALHRILNEWADIIPAHFDAYPLIEVDAAQRMLTAQAAAPHG